MILKTLVENTSVSSDYKHKHGMCFYIETGNHKILFDLGKNGLFLKKLKKKSKVLITPYSFYLSIIINITLWAPITHYLKQIYFCPKSPSFLMTAWAAASKIDQSPFLHIMEHFLKL
jgi:hypothetical protein